MIPYHLQNIYRAVLRGKLNICSYYRENFLHISDNEKFPSNRLWIKFSLHDDTVEIIVPYILFTVTETIGYGIINTKIIKNVP